MTSHCERDEKTGDLVVTITTTPGQSEPAVERFVGSKWQWLRLPSRQPIDAGSFSGFEDILMLNRIAAAYEARQKYEHLA